MEFHLKTQTPCSRMMGAGVLALALARSWVLGLGYILLTAMHCLKHYGRALRLYGSYARGRKRPWHVIVDFSSLSYSYNIRNPAWLGHTQAYTRPSTAGPVQAKARGWLRRLWIFLHTSVCRLLPLFWSTSTSASSSSSSLWASCHVVRATSYLCQKISTTQTYVMSFLLFGSSGGQEITRTVGTKCLGAHNFT